MKEVKATPATRSATGEIEIDAPPEVVWHALTDAQELVRWFPLEARVEPGEGGKIWISWKNEFQAESEIRVWDAPRHLRHAWGAPEWHGGTEAAQVTDYYLEGRGGKTFLRVVTSGFPDEPVWDGWVEGTRQGWRFELASLKHYLERHRGEEREVVYLRRRVPITREEAWSRVMSADGLGERPLSGRPFVDEPPGHYAAVIDDLGGALLRISMEPCFGRDDVREVVLWLSGWGASGERVARLRREWQGLLERLYPEGEAV